MQRAPLTSRSRAPALTPAAGPVCVCAWGRARMSPMHDRSRACKLNVACTISCMPRAKCVNACMCRRCTAAAMVMRGCTHACMYAHAPGAADVACCQLPRRRETSSSPSARLPVHTPALTVRRKGLGELARVAVLSLSSSPHTQQHTHYDARRIQQQRGCRGWAAAAAAALQQPGGARGREARATRCAGARVRGAALREGALRLR